MGFLSRLKSLFSPAARRVVETHRVWMTQRAKVRGIAEDVRRMSDDGTPCVVVAHFANTLQGMRSLLDGLSIRFEELSDRPSREELDRLLIAEQPRVLLAMAETLPTDPSSTDAPPDDGGEIGVIAIEHHLLPGPDERVRAFAAALPHRCRLQIHAALDDAVLRAFAGDWVAEVLRTLGMKEDEAIESALVHRRIRSAQRRIAKTATGHQPAWSAEEWMAANYPT